MNLTDRIRYDALVATAIGVLAVAVSAYTAYVQRQQVRAQVWPIVEYGSGNEPELNLWLANKGVGPALIRHVRVFVDDHPHTDWNGVLKALLGPARYSYSMDTIGGRVLSAGERIAVLSPHFDRASADWKRFDEERFRVRIEICYCSTLGDCWTLNAFGRGRSSTEEAARCPASSGTTFQQ